MLSLFSKEVESASRVPYNTTIIHSIGSSSPKSSGNVKVYSKDTVKGKPVLLEWDGTIQIELSIKMYPRGMVGKIYLFSPQLT